MFTAEEIAESCLSMTTEDVHNIMTELEWEHNKTGVADMVISRSAKVKNRQYSLIKREWAQRSKILRVLSSPEYINRWNRTASIAQVLWTEITTNPSSSSNYQFTSNTDRGEFEQLKAVLAERLPKIIPEGLSQLYLYQGRFFRRANDGNALWIVCDQENLASGPE